MTEIPFNLMTYTMFAPHISQVFQVHLGEGKTVPIELIQAKEKVIHEEDGRMGPGNIPVRTDPFGLLFIGPGDLYLPQRLYAFSHPVMGKFTMCIVPVGKDSRGFIYEAVFN